MTQTSAPDESQTAAEPQWRSVGQAALGAPGPLHARSHAGTIVTPALADLRDER